GEDYEEEALQLFDDVLAGRIAVACSEWALLEIFRGLRKAGFPSAKISESHDVLKELVELDYLELVPVSEVLDHARKLIINLNLYASDAVHLATALKRERNLVSEDRHLLRSDVIQYAQEHRVKVFRLIDIKTMD
ncbi:MAG: PIN domain-containing protein, partial [Thermofilaceae archaeon]